jgi:hypothetical protein
VAAGAEVFAGAMVGFAGADVAAGLEPTLQAMPMSKTNAITKIIGRIVFIFLLSPYPEKWRIV